MEGLITYTGEKHKMIMFGAFGGVLANQKIRSFPLGHYQTTAGVGLGGFTPLKLKRGGGEVSWPRTPAKMDAKTLLTQP